MDVVLHTWVCVGVMGVRHANIGWMRLTCQYGTESLDVNSAHGASCLTGIGWARLTFLDSCI